MISMKIWAKNTRNHVEFFCLVSWFQFISLVWICTCCSKILPENITSVLCKNFIQFCDKLYQQGGLFIIIFHCPIVFLFAVTKRLYGSSFPSIHLFVHLSVWPSHLFSICSCHRIMKFSGFVIIDKSDVHAKGQGQRSKVKVKTNFTIIWVFPDHNSISNSQIALKLSPMVEGAWKRGPVVFQHHLSNLKVTQADKSTILTQIEHFQTNSNLNSQMATKWWCIKLEVA